MQNNKFVVRFFMTARLAFNDFKSKYAGSALGAVWALAEPIITVLIYRFVYSVAFGGGSIDGIPYYLWLSAGIAPWFFISDGLYGTAAAFRDYSFLVKKMRFDKSVLPSVRAMSAMLSHTVFLLLVLILCVANKAFSADRLMYLIIGAAAAYIFVYSAGRILALLCAAYKDVLNALGIILNIGFWITPIFWNPKNVSGFAALAIKFNPAAGIVGLYRHALLNTDIPPCSDILYLTAICIILLLFGRISEKRYLPDIADKL